MEKCWRSVWGRWLRDRARATQRSGGKVPQVGGTAWRASVLHQVTEQQNVQYNYDVLGMWCDLG